MKLYILLAFVILYVSAVTSTHTQSSRASYRRRCWFKYRRLIRKVRILKHKLAECRAQNELTCEHQPNHSCLYATESDCNNNGYGLTTAFACTTTTKACCVRKPCEDQLGHTCQYPDEVTCNNNGKSLTTSFACPASTSGVCCKTLCSDVPGHTCLFSLPCTVDPLYDCGSSPNPCCLTNV